MIALSSIVAGYESIRRLVDPQPNQPAMDRRRPG